MTDDDSPPQWARDWQSRDGGASWVLATLTDLLSGITHRQQNEHTMRTAFEQFHRACTETPISKRRALAELILNPPDPATMTRYTDFGE